MEGITVSQVSQIVKMYVEQAIKPGGLSVDKLPYSDQIREIVNITNAKHEKQLTEKDIYCTLMLLRKTGKLPKIFRQSEHESSEDK